MEKVCSKCGSLKTLDEFRSYWDKRKGRTPYHRADCKKCEMAVAHKYEKDHPDKARLYRKKWRDANPEKMKIKADRWRAANPTKYREGLLRSAIKWKKKNLEKVRIYASRSATKRKMQKLQTPFEQRATALYQLALLQKAKDYGRCPLCGEEVRQWSLEHAIPLSRGGQHTEDNIYYCCLSCNCRKRHKTLEEFWGRGIEHIPYL